MTLAAIKLSRHSSTTSMVYKVEGVDNVLASRCVTVDALSVIINILMVSLSVMQSQHRVDFEIRIRSVLHTVFLLVILHSTGTHLWLLIVAFATVCL